MGHRRVVDDVVGGPVCALAPRVRVQVQRHVVDGVNPGKCHRVHAVVAVARGVGARLVSLAVEALVPRSDHVVRVDRLDVPGDVGHPRRDLGGDGVLAVHSIVDGAVLRGAKAVPGALAPRLVGQFPPKDGWVFPVYRLAVDVGPLDEVGCPGLVPPDDDGVAVEIVVVAFKAAATAAAVRCRLAPRDVLVHPAKVLPVVGERQEHPQPELPCAVDHVVKVRERRVIVLR
mmetsp:Transcript_14526/g.37374  ORF Transcript_14526/g.37374 Transcript_14526/m.37374 type:complete len:230 (+) Transcript_14526:435-1124(+)